MKNCIACGNKIEQGYCNCSAVDRIIIEQNKQIIKILKELNVSINNLKT